MRHTARILLFVAGVAFGLVVSFGISAQQQRAGKLTQLLKKDVVGCEGKEVVVSTLEAGPGVSPSHYHPGESFIYVAEGKQTRAGDGDPTTTVDAGGFIYDSFYQVHQTENEGPVKLFIVRILDKGKPETIRAQ